MNETIKTILERRSIRSYKKEQIKDSDIDQILEAGKFAPSAMNAQPWHFTVLQNTELMSKISELSKAGMLASNNKRFIALANRPDFSNFHNAPTAIIISSQEGPYSMADCANAAQNMVLAAQSLNLGSCYTASFAAAMLSPAGKEIIVKLGIPAVYRPLFAVCLGFQEGEAPQAAPRKEGTVNYIR